MLFLLVAAVLGAPTDTVPRGAILLSAAWASVASAGADADLYLAIVNEGSVPFAVLEVTTDVADSVGSVGLGASGEGGRRMPSAFIVMPGRRLTMRPDQARLRLLSLRQGLTADRPFAVILKCANGTSLRVMVDVRRAAPILKGKVA